MTFVSYILITLACIVISYFILTYRRQSSVKSVNSLPGPKAFPLIGSAYYFFQSSANEFLDIIIKLTKYYSSPFQFWMGNKLFIVMYKLDQMKEILQNSLEKSNTIYKIAEPILGKEGLVTASQSTWAKNRKLIAPCLNNNMLQKYFDVFVEQSLILTDTLEKIGLNKNKIILFEHISKFTFSTTLGTMVNIEIKDLLNHIDQFLELIARVKKIITLRLRNIFLYSDFIFNLTAIGREQQKCLDFAYFLIKKIVQQKEKNVKSKNKPTYDVDKTLLDILLEALHKDKFSYKMMYDNLLTMLLASFDTTSLTINFVIFMLANFPETQERVYKELMEIYGTQTLKSAPIKYEDLQHMSYLDCVIKETIRLFPPLPIIGRHLTKDVKIGKFNLPKDAEVFFVILNLHRNEKYWPHPLVFDPDRFLPENIGTSYSSYFTPFSMGPKNCIGKNFAMTLMKVVLATLIRTFVFKVDKSIQIDEIKLNMNITLSTVEPLEVKIEKRNLH